MPEAIAVLHELNGYAASLNKLAAQLDAVEAELEGVGLQYEEFMAKFEEGLWEAHVAGAKFPPSALRERMGRRAMPPELLGSYIGLTTRRKRLTANITALKQSMEAKRSILSALKEGLVS